VQFVYILVGERPGDFLGFPGLPNVKGTPPRPRRHYIRKSHRRSFCLRLLKVS